MEHKGVVKWGKCRLDVMYIIDYHCQLIERQSCQPPWPPPPPPFFPVSILFSMRFDGFLSCPTPTTTDFRVSRDSLTPPLRRHNRYFHCRQPTPKILIESKIGRQRINEREDGDIPECLSPNAKASIWSGVDRERRPPPPPPQPLEPPEPIMSTKFRLY